jgi:hypothetical protein
MFVSLLYGSTDDTAKINTNNKQHTPIIFFSVDKFLISSNRPSFFSCVLVVELFDFVGYRGAGSSFLPQLSHVLLIFGFI